MCLTQAVYAKIEIYDICPKYDKYVRGKRFDKIIKKITEYLLEKVPFKDKASLNRSLIGDCPTGINNKGYLGWHLNLIYSKFIDSKNISITEIKELLKNPEIIDFLKQIYNLSQEFFIKPMMEIMLEKSDNIKKCNMQKELNLNKLENGHTQSGRICSELYMRLVYEGLMKGYKENNSVYYKTIQKNYKAPDFILPNY